MAFEYVPYEGPVVTLSEARGAGLKRYFSGVACPKGHIAQRYVTKSGCVACTSERTARWRFETPERSRASNAAWKAANAAKVKADNAALYARKKARYREIERAWRRANPDKRRMAEQRYRSAHPEYVKAKNAARMTRVRSSTGRYTGADILALFDIQRGRCAHSWCRADLKDAYHADHVMPLARGGSNDRKNIQLLCPICNIMKNAKDPIAWAQQNGLLL